MPSLIISRLHGRASYAIDYCADPRPSTGLATELFRLPLTDAEAELGPSALAARFPVVVDGDSWKLADPAKHAPPAPANAVPLALTPEQAIELATRASLSARHEPVILLLTTPVSSDDSWIRRQFEYWETASVTPDEDDALGEGWARRAHD